MVGEVLFFVLRHVLSQQVYHQSVHTAWVKVYSRMLTTIVPQAVSLEINSGSKAQVERFSGRSSFMFSSSQDNSFATGRNETGGTSRSAGISVGSASGDEQNFGENGEVLKSSKLRDTEYTTSGRVVSVSTKNK